MSSDSVNLWESYLKMGFTMLLWGIAWPVGKFLVIGLPPISVAAVRYSIVVVVFFPLLQLREGLVRVPRAWIGTFIFLGLLSVTLYQAFFLLGVEFAAASDDSLVIGLSPIVVAVLASFVVQEQLNWHKITGLLLGLAGVGLVYLLSQNTDATNRALGMSLIVGGVVVYALYTVYLRKFIKDHNSNQDGERTPSSLAILTWVSFFGWLFLIPFSLLEAPWTYNWNLGSWLGIGYLALFSTVIGYLLYVQGVAEIGATRAAIFANLVPVFGVVFSALLLAEKLSVWYAVSFALIFAGVYLVNRRF